MIRTRCSGWLLLRRVLLQSWQPMSRSLREETYVINVYVHLLSDLSNCRFLSSILIAVYFLADPKGRARRATAILGFQVKHRNRTACTAMFSRLLGPAWLRSA